jgi:predicted ester cyclase
LSGLPSHSLESAGAANADRLEVFDPANRPHTLIRRVTTDILAMIEEGNRVSGKMRFHGYHRQELFGVAPSGRHVWWIGMPIFTFEWARRRATYSYSATFTT